MIGEFAGVERRQIRLGDKDGSFGNSQFQYEPSRGPDGNPTTMCNAAFGFAPVFEMGKTTGRLQIFGRSVEPHWGEAADYLYSSEAAG